MEKVKKIGSSIVYWHERILLATEITLGQPWDIVIIRILFKYHLITDSKGGMLIIYRERLTNFTENTGHCSLA